MKLEVIVKALKWLEIDMDVDEVISLIFPPCSLLFPICLYLSKMNAGDYCCFIMHFLFIYDAFAGRVYSGHTDI